MKEFLFGYTKNLPLYRGLQRHLQFPVSFIISHNTYITKFVTDHTPYHEQKRQVSLNLKIYLWV